MNSMGEMKLSEKILEERRVPLQLKWEGTMSRERISYEIAVLEHYITQLEEEMAECQDAYHIQGRDKRILKAENRQLRRIIEVNAPDVDVDYNLDALKEGG